MRTIFILVMIASGCKNISMPPADARTVSSDTAVPSWKDDPISFYDSIKAPILSVDTSFIYNQLPDLLRFTNELKKDATESLYEAVFKVDNKAKVILLRRSSTPILNKEMSQVEDALMKYISVVEPASLVGDDSAKVDYTLTISFLVEDQRILFRLFGAENKFFLYKDFKRPL